MDATTQPATDTTSRRPGYDAKASPLRKRRGQVGRTRQGKIRLLTLDQLDGRSAAFRDAQKLIDELAAEMGGKITAFDREHLEHAAMLGAIARDFEVRWAAGEQIALVEYLSTLNVQRRYLADLELRRRLPDDDASWGAMIRREQRQRQLESEQHA